MPVAGRIKRHRRRSPKETLCRSPGGGGRGGRSVTSRGNLAFYPEREFREAFEFSRFGRQLLLAGFFLRRRKLRIDFPVGPPVSVSPVGQPAFAASADFRGGGGWHGGRKGVRVPDRRSSESRRRPSALPAPTPTRGA